MAHVSPPSHESVETRRERAQLFIVIGFVLAITLVALALFLNSVIYAENVGARGADIGGSDAVDFATAAETDGGGILRAANHAHHNYSDQRDAFERGLADWNEQSRLHHTSGGVYTNVSVEHEQRGTQIVQDSDRAFTSANNTTTWRLATDVEARDFVMNVSRDNLSSGGTDSFRLSVTESGLPDGQNLSIYENGGNITIANESGPVCETSEDRARIDFAARTLNGEKCDLTTVFEGADSYSIWYVNGHQIEGTYRFVVDADDPDPGPSLPLTDAYNAPENSPYTADAIYAADVAVVYEGPRVEHESTITIEPGEIDD